MTANRAVRPQPSAAFLVLAALEANSPTELAHRSVSTVLRADFRANLCVNAFLLSAFGSLQEATACAIARPGFFAPAGSLLEIKCEARTIAPWSEMERCLPCSAFA